MLVTQSAAILLQQPEQTETVFIPFPQRSAERSGGNRLAKHIITASCRVPLNKIRILCSPFNFSDANGRNDLHVVLKAESVLL